MLVDFLPASCSAPWEASKHVLDRLLQSDFINIAYIYIFNLHIYIHIFDIFDLYKVTYLKTSHDLTPKDT